METKYNIEEVQELEFLDFENIEECNNCESSFLSKKYLFNELILF
ncbi:hypothetical protein [Mammaliicoccus lentus]|nr:hypothetical protein [Mammaliicoccus lentus]